jgi:hypothetical protein
MREEIAWLMRRQGASVRQVARKLGLSTSGAHKLIKRVERKEAARIAKDRENIRGRQNMWLECMIQKEFAAHRKSAKVRSRVTQRTMPDGSQITVSEATDGIGDSAHHRTVLACMEAQSELSGLNIQAAANPAETLSELSARLDAEIREHDENEARECTLEEQLAEARARAESEYRRRAKQIKATRARLGLDTQEEPPCGEDNPSRPPGPGSTTPG